MHRLRSHPLPLLLAPVAGLFSYALAGGDVSALALQCLGLLTLGAVLAPVALLGAALVLRVFSLR